jgi:hypothetical protein
MAEGHYLDQRGWPLETLRSLVRRHPYDKLSRELALRVTEARIFCESKPVVTDDTYYALPCTD